MIIAPVVMCRKTEMYSLLQCEGTLVRPDWLNREWRYELIGQES